jgi:sulfur-oxidizing protein SoxZ
MSKTSRTSVTVPAQAKKGAVIEIRAIAQHDMESGFRYTEGGKIIARDIIRTFTCSYNQVEVFKADFYPGIGANPLIILLRLQQKQAYWNLNGVGMMDMKLAIRRA